MFEKKSVFQPVLFIEIQEGFIIYGETRPYIAFSQQSTEFACEEMSALEFMRVCEVRVWLCARSCVRMCEGEKMMMSMMMMMMLWEAVKVSSNTDVVQ